MFRPYSRPFDPTGESEQNFVLGEYRDLRGSDKRVFVLSHGPFYLDGFTMTERGRVLVEGEDYSFVINQPEVTMRTGKSCAVAVRVIGNAVQEFNATYHAVGGEYQDLISVLKSIKENNGSSLVPPIHWDNIVDKPKDFWPSAHMHIVWDIDGWEEGMVTSLDQIRQAILYKKRVKTEGIYTYAQAHFKAIENVLVEKIREVYENLMEVNQNSGYPDGFCTFGTARFKGSKEWVRHPENTMVQLVTKDADIGKRRTISEEIVYGTPDNILLFKVDEPIHRDDEEYMFLDNKHPADPKGISGGGNSPDDYWEDIDEQFDMVGVKLLTFNKNTVPVTATIGRSSSNLTVTAPVTFTVRTTGIPNGTKLPYLLTGLRAENVDVPISGTMSVNNDRATIKVGLVADSPATYETVMTIEVAVLSGLTSSVKYVLPANITPLLGLSFRNSNSTASINAITNGDSFIIRVDITNSDGKDFILRSNFPAALKYTVNGVTPVTNDPKRSVTVKNTIPLNSNGYLDVAVRTIGNWDNATLTGHFYVDQPKGTVKSTDLKVNRLTVTFVAISVRDGSTIKEVKTNDRFYLAFQFNTRQFEAYKIAMLSSAVKPDMKPNSFGVVYPDSSGYGRTEEITYMGDKVGVGTWTLSLPFSTKLEQLTLNVRKGD